VAKPLPRAAMAPPVQFSSQLAPGARLVPEAHRCPICNPHWYHTPDPKCPACGGTGKVLGWRVEQK
jgi:rubrerythrin